MLKALAFTIALCATASGCDELTSADICASKVVVSVNDAAKPVIDWSPNCRVSQLTVADSTGAVWVVLGQSTFAPRVTYGTVPSGARETVPPETLKSGATYSVRLEVESEAGLDVGNAAFVHAHAAADRLPSQYPII